MGQSLATLFALQIAALDDCRFTEADRLELLIQEQTCPLKRCDDCRHMAENEDGGHCYMFQTEPQGKHCGQFKTR